MAAVVAVVVEAAVPVAGHRRLPSSVPGEEVSMLRCEQSDG